MHIRKRLPFLLLCARNGHSFYTVRSSNHRTLNYAKSIENDGDMSNCKQLPSLQLGSKSFKKNRGNSFHLKATNSEAERQILFLQDGRELAFDEEDERVREVVRQTDCNPLDARWALEAKSGRVIDAVIAIQVARRLAAQPATTIPGGEFGTMYEEDWDDDWAESVQSPSGNKINKEKWAEKEQQIRQGESEGGTK